MRKKFFAPINFQVFLKHLPSHKESIGMLGEQIGQWEGSKKSEHTHKNTDIRKLLYGSTVYLMEFQKSSLLSQIKDY